MQRRVTARTVMAVAWVGLLWAGTATATVSPQENCDKTRVTVWRTYKACVESVVAKDALGSGDNDFEAFGKCRHSYFGQWAKLQKTKALATSTCRPADGLRFVDNGDGSVSDLLTSLVWEQKTSDGTVHDQSNTYTWSTNSPTEQNGTAFTTFLSAVNAAGFAGANGWRLPTMIELQTIIQDFPCSKPSCSCGSDPCIDSTFGPTESGTYWSGTEHLPVSNRGWSLSFHNAGTSPSDLTIPFYTRAVRGGL